MAKSVAQSGAGLALAVPPERRYRALKMFLRSRQGVLGLAIALAMVLAAVLAPIIAPYDPLAQDLAHKFNSSNSQHWLGTDQFGRDVLSRMLFGAQISLSTGLVSVIVGSVLGVLAGVVAAFYGGWIEIVTMAAVDVLMGFRSYLLAILIVAILGTSEINLMVAIGLATFPQVARLIRSEVLSVKRRDFVDAARSLGATDGRIMLRHVLPQVVSPLVVVATFNFALAVTVESSLSFLGLGPPPPTPTWGLMIAEGRQYILSTPWLPAIPGVAIMLTVLAFNMLGDAMRDVLDPRLRNQKT
ncbi:MAG: ABC transporter permease [Actinobacteria bacterium]|nr:ABC transporter permease [Actinomycetota bacterium]